MLLKQPSFKRYARVPTSKTASGLKGYLAEVHDKIKTMLKEGSNVTIRARKPKPKSGGCVDSIPLVVRSQSLGQIARDSPYGLNQKRQSDNFDHQKILVHHNHPSQSLSAEKQHRNSLLIRSSHWARQMKRLFPRMRTYIVRNRSYLALNHYLALNQSRDLSTICTSEFV